jgi:hypothetical protein
MQFLDRDRCVEEEKKKRFAISITAQQISSYYIPYFRLIGAIHLAPQIKRKMLGQINI